MVVLDCGEKRLGLARFVDKREKHRGGRPRRSHSPRCRPPPVGIRPYSAIASPEPPNSAGKVLQLWQTVAHRQHRLGVVDMNTGGEGQGRDRRGENVHQANRRMIDHQVSAALRAILALAELRLLKLRDMFGTRFDPHRIRLPEAEGVDRPAGPRTARPAMTVAYGLWPMASGDPVTSISTVPQKQLPE